MGIVLVASRTFGDLKGRHFSIMTVLDEPFVSINYFERGNDRFSGYAIEMLQTVAARGEFSYTLKLPDNGTFDSAVAAVETGVADMVWGSFFLTGSRAAKLDFTAAFADSGLRMVVRRPSPRAVLDRMFVFLQPFSADLWVSLLIAVLVTGTVLWYLERGIYRAYFDQRFDQLFMPGVFKGLYLAFSFFTGTSEFVPRTRLARCYATTWSILVLITTSAYTANLASYLTQQSLNADISSLSDLIRLDKAACVLDGSATVGLVAKEQAGIRLQLVRTRQAMFTSVLNGSCDAAVLDSLPAQYATSRGDFCDLRLAGDLFALQNYAVGLRRLLSEYTAPLSLILVDLRESGYLQQLYEKYFVDNADCDPLQYIHVQPQTTAKFTTADLLGLFLILLVTTAIIVALKVYTMYAERAQSLVDRLGKDEWDPVLEDDWPGAMVIHEDKPLPLDMAWRVAPHDDEWWKTKLRKQRDAATSALAQHAARRQRKKTDAGGSNEAHNRTSTEAAGESSVPVGGEPPGPRVGTRRWLRDRNLSISMHFTRNPLQHAMSDPIGTPGVGPEDSGENEDAPGDIHSGSEIGVTPPGRAPENGTIVEYGDSSDDDEEAVLKELNALARLGESSSESGAGGVYESNGEKLATTGPSDEVSPLAEASQPSAESGENSPLARVLQHPVMRRSAQRRRSHAPGGGIISRAKQSPARGSRAALAATRGELEMSARATATATATATSPATATATATSPAPATAPAARHRKPLTIPTAAVGQAPGSRASSPGSHMSSWSSDELENDIEHEPSRQ